MQAPLSSGEVASTYQRVQLLSAKIAGDATPRTVAATVNEPVRLFPVNVDEVALPLPSVRTVSAGPLVLANVPLAPLADAANVTLIPAGTGFP